MARSDYDFSPRLYEEQLASLIDEIERLPRFDPRSYETILRKYPKDGRGFFSKSDLIRGFHHLNRIRGWGRNGDAFAEKIRMKPVRTLSGVAPVTVLTKPYPCPGRCIFCPSDVRMPKSYLSSEPGAQRAAQHRFDPYAQTLSRLLTLHRIGHRVDKVELIVLGGTWSSYPESYQIWFVARCLQALNDFGRRREGGAENPTVQGIDFERLRERVDGRRPGEGYNRIVARFLGLQGELEPDGEIATWQELDLVQRDNERAAVRCVGLVLETRPDRLELEEVERLRRLGATKVQIGFQSLSDRILRLNRRGHDVAATRRAMELLRRAGFKIHAHWMPNLYGSTPGEDLDDFRRMFDDPAFRPDELKVYPCSLVESAELMSRYESGQWRPYGGEELLELLVQCLALTPEYCRVTRVIRDIPGTDIVTGNRVTNLREAAEREVERRGLPRRNIRAREVRDRTMGSSGLGLSSVEYGTSTGREIFLQFADERDRLAGFLRLSLPDVEGLFAEIAASALIREVHVYGLLAGLGERQQDRSQHRGLGRAMIAEAQRRARRAGFSDLAVISSIGTREYYRRLGFRDGPLYQHHTLD